MKRMICLLVALICLMVFPAAFAEMADVFLYSPALDAMVYLEGEGFPEGYSESYMTEDGLMIVEVLTVEAAEYGMVGEGSFEELMDLRTEGDMANIEYVACEGVCSYPAQRIRFETGENEDSSVVDATAIWTEGKTFVYIVTASADAWFGFVDLYAEGEMQAMVDAWIGEIQIGDPAFDEMPAELYMISPALGEMIYQDTEEYEAGVYEGYLSEDGLIFVEVLNLEAAEYGMVGEGSFEELMALRAEGGMVNVEYVECDGVCSYPAQRIRFETGENEDSSVVDATAIWTEDKTFVYIVTADADAWYGFMDGYEEGDMQAMIELWISELQILEF